MRILCQFSSALISPNGAVFRNRPGSKATVSICEKGGEAFIQVFTEKIKGDKYKIKNNIKKCMTRFMNEGKLTIELLEPKINLMISKAENSQLQKFCKGLKLGLKGESLVGTGLLSSGIVKPKKIGKTLKININSKADYKTKLSKEKGFPQELLEFQANGLGLRQIDTRLFRLKNLKILNLTRNDLCILNSKLCQLRLTSLILSNNKLKSLPSNYIDSPLAKSLQKLDLSHNSIDAMSSPVLLSSINLESLSLDNNNLISLPSRYPPKLKFLSAKENKINFGSFCRNHRFDHLDVSSNPFGMKPSDIIALPQMKSTASKLVEIAARNYLKLRFNYNNIIMPDTLCVFLNKAIYCPCSEPIWVRRFMFLAEYDVRKYSKSPIAPRGTDFILPQLEFCCSIRCLNKYKNELEYKAPPEPEAMQVEPAE